MVADFFNWIISIGGGPSYLNFFLLFLAKIFIALLMFLGLALVVFDSIISRIAGVLVIFLAIVASFVLLGANLYAAYLVFQRGADSFLDFLLLILYVIGALTSLVSFKYEGS